MSTVSFSLLDTASAQCGPHELWALGSGAAVRANLFAEPRQISVYAGAFFRCHPHGFTLLA